MRAVILAGGTGMRLAPVTLAVNKHLWPLGELPVIYYSLALVMRAGVRELALVVSPESEAAFKRLLGDGEDLGIRIEYLQQPRPAGIADALLHAEEFVDGNRFGLVLGDGLFLSQDIASGLQRALEASGRAGIFACHSDTPQDFAVIELSPEGEPCSLQEKPAQPRSSLVVPGLYTFPPDVFGLARVLRPSPRGELEVTDLNAMLLQQGMLDVRVLPPDTGWFDLGTFERWHEAHNLVFALKDRGFSLGSPHLVAWNSGWIGKEALLSARGRAGGSPYGQQLQRLIDNA